MTKSERLGHLLVGLPIAHVLGSALFLWSFCAGFGANLEALASVSDILNVTITDMVPTYFASGIWFALLIFVQVLLGSSRISAKTKIFAASAILLLISSVGIYSILSDSVPSEGSSEIPNRTFYELIFISVTLFIVNISARAVGASGLTVSIYELGGIFIWSLFFGGVSAGYRERHANYQHMSSSYLRCGKYLVLRRIGDNYLAVAPSDRKVIIDKDCTVKYAIPDKRP